MKMRISIIHFLPIELYPPVLNLIDFLVKDIPHAEIHVYTLGIESTIDKYENAKVKIFRYKSIDPLSNYFVKIARYFTFNFGVLLKLINFNPQNILYFETLSAFPAVVYKYIKNTKIFAHYHEIVTLDELNDGRTMNKLINNLEKVNYKKFHWISHTNKARLTIFLKQYNLKKDDMIQFILPNYPPKSWGLRHHSTGKVDTTTRLLHIGALSLNALYLKEILHRFGSNLNYTIDFYSHSFSSDVSEIILSHDNCRILGAINYKDIPKLKGLYDVGLVLYKGTSENEIYSVPNKVFEYLALDIDVWCSDKLITASEYERSNCFPKVLMIDYTRLDQFDLHQALDKTGLNYVSSPYFCETIYKQISNQLYT